MHELVEAEQYDPLMPIEWVYHTDWDLKDLLNHVRVYNDKLRIEDEMEDEEFWK